MTLRVKKKRLSHDSRFTHVLSQSALGLGPRRLSRAADGKKEWDAGGQCLDAAHGDDQTYGRENPLQDSQDKHHLCALSSV